MSFGSRLHAAMRDYGPLCVGIDPHPHLLESWGLRDNAESLRVFSRTVLEASFRHAAAVKPNAAFFERHGSQGIAALEELLATAREQGTLTILDAKRGDIGSTMKGYADSYLSEGAPLEADSVTLSPYLGFGSLKPALELAEHTGKGIFVLALTSNPEGASVQHATDAQGNAVAKNIVDAAARLNAGATPMGNIGLVVGATVGSAVADLGIDLDTLNGPILAPGVGAQGAGSQQVNEVFGNSRGLVLVNQSRGVLSAGPFVEKLRAAIVAATQSAQEILHP